MAASGNLLIFRYPGIHFQETISGDVGRLAQVVVTAELGKYEVCDIGAPDPAAGGFGVCSRPVCAGHFTVDQTGRSDRR